MKPTETTAGKPTKTTAGAARARTFANIALAKYWGKSDITLNLPAVPSISVTLDPLRTETTVRFVEGLEKDEVFLDGKAATSKESKRVIALLDQVRDRASINHRARVESRNDFPTAAGLASSASGFAALAGAACRAARLDANEAELSAMARQASASAARSIFGGFAELPAGIPGNAELCAHRIAPASHWDIRVLVAVVQEGPKDVGSTEGMEHSRETSPFYQSWVEKSVALNETVRRGIEERNLELLGPAMEQSTMAFHSCALSSSPPIMYWQPSTLAVLKRLFRARKTDALSVWCTMDAGPHVKAVCEAKDADRVQSLLSEIPEVLRVISAKPGSGIEIEDLET